MADDKAPQIENPEKITAKELNDLYKRLENFIADCTRSEVDANRDALNKVQSMIHQRMILTNK